MVVNGAESLHVLCETKKANDLFVDISAKRRAISKKTDRDSDAESTGSTCEVGWMSEQVQH